MTRRRGAQLFKALRNPNFRYYFIGQVLSVSGTWMQRVAQSWLAYRLTGSSTYLGVVSFAASAPAFLLTPLGGLLADQYDRRKLMIWAQSLSLLQAAVLAWTTLNGSITPGLLVALSITLSLINAFENPARQSFYTDMVPPEDLANAVAVNASLVNLARLAGPAMAGITVALWGEGVCFVLNALSFLAVLWALLMMRIPPHQRTGSAVTATSGTLVRLREGLAFVRTSPSLKRMLANFSLFNFAGSPYLTLLPLLAAGSLNSGPTSLGWLVSSSGAGAVIASLYLASRTGTEGLPQMTFRATIVAGLALIVLGLSRSMWLSMPAIALIGAGYVFALAGTQTMMQTSVPDEIRGRVMSYYSALFLGVPPIGSLFAGVVAEKLSTPVTLMIGGSLCALGAGWWALTYTPRTRSQSQ